MANVGDLIELKRKVWELKLGIYQIINIRPNEMLAKLIDTEDTDYKDIIGTHGLLIPKENQYYTIL